MSLSSCLFFPVVRAYSCVVIIKYHKWTISMHYNLLARTVNVNVNKLRISKYTTCVLLSRSWPFGLIVSVVVLKYLTHELFKIVFKYNIVIVAL